MEKTTKLLFNSTEFFIFFPIVTAIYFLLSHKYRVYWLLAASCLFYMTFIPKYIFILLSTILVDYFAGLMLHSVRDRRARRACLLTSVILTCAILFVFKYYNFFNDSAAAIAAFLHIPYAVSALKIILPIGLSFHTFQSLSYVIEVYRGKQAPERNFWYYSLYVMFYPQLVAGPIERPQNLLHQFREEHVFEYQRVSHGLKLMAWGLFKKVVIADSLAILVNAVYENPTKFAGIPLIIATIFFAIQIYCDFSGYSDIAIGSAQVMGFNLMTNFDKPYFSKSVSEFWRRWHISLSTWFKDYVYVSLGGNRAGMGRIAVNLMITFLVSGLWHGANWTFIVWGGLNGLYIVLARFTDRAKTEVTKRLPSLATSFVVPDVFRVAGTFFLINLTWVFFRARTISEGFWILGNMGAGVAGTFHRLMAEGWKIIPAETFLGYQMGMDHFKFLECLLLILLLFILERFQSPRSLRQLFVNKAVWVRWPAYMVMAYSVLYFLLISSQKSQFIYFQF